MCIAGINLSLHHMFKSNALHQLLNETTTHSLYTTYDASDGGTALSVGGGGAEDWDLWCMAGKCHPSYLVNSSAID